ncbi:MAG: hypothetical protein P8Y70_09690 [Candidatus Lokiarchaeota archaeon]
MSVKKGLFALKEVTPLIIKGVITFLLLCSGLFIGLIFRYLDYNAGVIIFFGLITEAIGLILIYLFIKNYLKVEEEESEESNSIKKKK